MGMAALSGCVSLMTDAMFPDNMHGKMGSINDGVVFCSWSLWFANT
jgi:hypothetical protein